MPVRPRRIRLLAMLGVVFVTTLLERPASVFGQNQKETKETLRLTDPVFLPPDRSLVRMLHTAAELMDQGRYSEATRALAAILNAEEDYFVPSAQDNEADRDGGGQTYVSLKNQARRIVGQFPSEARKSYELQFGGTAETLLNRAIKEADIESVADVTRRFAHTAASYRAMLLLGQFHLDQGRPLGAALCFQYVHDSHVARQFEPELSLLLSSCWLRADEVENARKVVSGLKQKSKTDWIEIGGQRVPFYGDEKQALNWLSRVMGRARVGLARRDSDWIMFRGNASRTAQSDGGVPLLVRPRWVQRIARDNETESVLETARRDHSDQLIAALPAFQPLALDNMVLMRVPGRLAAIDFRTGKLIWQVETATARRTETSDPQEAEDRSNALLKQRVWNDRTYSSISSDGHRVYVLEEFHREDDGTLSSFFDPNTGRRHVYSGKSYNVLAAYDVKESQGKRLWSSGGPNEGDARFSSAFFLGAPLAMQGRLYNLVEMEGEVRLVVLEASSGKLLWSQQLASVPQTPQTINQRQMSGISPSFAEGVLICPTGVGAIVGVDVTARSLLWGYEYPIPEDPQQRGHGWPQSVALAVNPGQTWADSCAVISGGRLVITPAESKFMHCLSLKDGRVQWRIDRDDLLYLGCLHNNTAVLVGKDRLTGIDLATGKVAKGWPMDLPEKCTPSGRGYYHDGNYYLPLNHAGIGQIAQIRIDAPSILQRLTSRDGTIPGNLISYGDDIISQNVDRLQVYYQIEPLREKVQHARVEDPQDIWATLREGEIQVSAGNSLAAVKSFREAYRRASRMTVTAAPASVVFAHQLEAQNLLLTSLLENLRNDFEAHRVTIDEIAALVASSKDEINFLRVLAVGQEQIGEHLQAANSYLKLVDATQVTNPMVSDERYHSVRLDRWVRARTERVAARLADDGQNDFVKLLEQRRDAVLADGSIDSLKNYLRFFRALPVADPVKQRLLTKLRNADDELEFAMILQELSRSNDVAVRRDAIAQLARVYGRKGLLREAAHYYERLRTEFAEEVCLGEKTGQQLYDDLPEDSRIRSVLTEQWPLTEVQVGSSDSRQTQIVPSSPSQPIYVLGEHHRMHDPVDVTVEQFNRLTARDGNGLVKWSVTLQRNNTRNIHWTRNRQWSCLRSDGPLMIAVVGNQVLAVDTLRPDDGSSGTRKILWRNESTQEPTNPTYRGRNSRKEGGMPPWQDSAATSLAHPTKTARLGPITAGGVTFIRNGDLLSVDAYTGDVMWRHRGVNNKSMLFGDEQYVVVAPEESNEATIFSTMDGARLQDVDLPDQNSRWTYIGRKVLTWTKSAKSNGVNELALYDPLEEKNDWVFSIKKDTMGRLIGMEQLALLQRDGHFFLLDLVTGEAVVDRMLEPEPQLKGIYLMRSSDHLMLITNSGATTQDNKYRYGPWPPPNGSTNDFISGRVYSLDIETGEPLWSLPAEIDRQGFVTNQPVESPVIVFARVLREKNSSQTKMTMTFLDKRTGRLLIPPKDLPRNHHNYYEVVCYPTRNAIAIYLQDPKNSFELTFTDQPIPPGPPLRVARPDSKSGLTLGKWLKALNKGVKQKKDDDDLFDEEAIDLFEDDE
ncbi:MAG: PQQ-binding-like beta-propeller repeat protein [Pirellulales bacterium]